MKRDFTLLLLALFSLSSWGGNSTLSDEKGEGNFTHILSFYTAIQAPKKRQKEEKQLSIKHTKKECQESAFSLYTTSIYKDILFFLAQKTAIDRKLQQLQTALQDQKREHHGARNKLQLAPEEPEGKRREGLHKNSSTSLTKGFLSRLQPSLFIPNRAVTLSVSSQGGLRYAQNIQLFRSTLEPGNHLL